MTFYILTDDSKRIICWSSVCSALKPESRKSQLGLIGKCDLSKIFDAPDPENPTIYNRYNDVPDNGEGLQTLSDTPSSFMKFPRGTKITKFSKDGPQTSVVACYNEDAQTYSVIFAGGTAEFSHDEIKKLYNPIIEQRADRDSINKEIEELAELDVCNPVEKLDELAGKTFLLDPLPDGTWQRAKIIQLVEGIKQHTQQVDKNPERIKFLVQYKINKFKKEELMTYEDILDYIQWNHEEQVGIYWKFWQIIRHQKVNRGDKDYKWSSWNLIIEWEDGEQSKQPLTLSFADAPYEFAEYALKKNLLYTDEWCCCQCYATKRNQFDLDTKHFQANLRYVKRKIYNTKVKSYNEAMKFKYGAQVTKNYLEACQLNDDNKNNLRKETITFEMLKLDEYKVFRDLGDV